MCITQTGMPAQLDGGDGSVRLDLNCQIIPAAVRLRSLYGVMDCPLSLKELKQVHLLLRKCAQAFNETKKTDILVFVEGFSPRAVQAVVQQHRVNGYEVSVDERELHICISQNV